MAENLDGLRAALAWHRAGHAVALATVAQTWGSAPRPAGSHLVIRDDALFVGSVSGGCVEGAVAEAALEVLRTGERRLLEFGVSAEQAWAVGLACGGRIAVTVAPLPVAVIEAAVAALDAGEAVALAMPLAGSAPMRRVEDADPLAETGRATLRSDRATVVTHAGADWLVTPCSPPLRLLLVGAVHIAQALAPMARLAGYGVTVIDPRRAFAAPERFPGIDVVDEWPDDALTALGIDARTAIVTLTHDPKLDDPALRVALASPAFYIGCLGSRRTHAARLERLEAEGHDATALARLHGPVGLSIGARTPAEIAVAILAELTQALRVEPT